NIGQLGVSYKVFIYGSRKEAVDSLQQGKIDVLVAGSMLSYSYEDKDVIFPTQISMKPTPLYMGVRKGVDKNILERINFNLRKMSLGENSIYSNLWHKHFGKQIKLPKWIFSLITLGTIIIVILIYLLIRSWRNMKLTTLEMEAKKHYLEITMKCIGDGIIICSADGKIQFINTAAEKLTGWKMHEALGQAIDLVYKVVDRETGQLMVNPVHKVLGTGVPHNSVENSMLKARNGQQYIVTDIATPIKYGDDKVKDRGVVVVFRDDTILEQRTEELRIFNKKMSLAVELGRLGIWEYSHKLGEIIHQSDFGNINISNSRKRESFVGMLTKIFPEYRSLVSEEMKRVVAGEKDFFSVQYKINSENNDFHWIQSSGIVVQRPDATNDDLILLGFSRDITEQVEFQNNLEKEKTDSNNIKKNLEELLASIRHEMKNPLESLESYMRQLDVTCRNNAHIVHCMGLSIHCIASLTDKFDQLSKVDKGFQIQRNKYAVHPNVLVKNIETIFMPQLMKKQLEFICSIDAHLPFVICDREFLVLILMNLVSNALEHTSVGYIKISVSYVNQSEGFTSVLFCVEDTGVGMQQESLEKMLNGSDISSNHGLGVRLMLKFAQAIGAKISGE
ncbi:MAG: PAS domain S-box protein, partial [Lentisphaeria bacterium]